MPKTTSKLSTQQQQKSKTISELERFIKAYDKQKKAQAELDESKAAALEYLKNNFNKYDKLKYKKCYLMICDRKTYNYSQLAVEMGEAFSKQKKLEELSGEATIKNITDYIRVDKEK